jgi:hypothetical protein
VLLNVEFWEFPCDLEGAEAGHGAWGLFFFSKVKKVSLYMNKTNTKRWDCALMLDEVLIGRFGNIY